jgi:hypothetical protein
MAPIQPKKRPADTIKAVLNFEDELKRKQAEAGKRQQVWQALNEYITRRNGFLVSPPGQRFLRVEIPQPSGLAGELRDLGYQLRLAGSNERIWGGRILPVSVFTFQIPPVK